MPFSLVVTTGACATGSPEQNFLLTTLSQESSGGNLVTLLHGLMALDELPADVRSQLISNGYEAGDLVPAICRMKASGENAPCDFHVRSSPDSEGGWWHIGTSRPELFDDLAEWERRKARVGSGLTLQGCARGCATFHREQPHVHERSPGDLRVAGRGGRGRRAAAGRRR